jgi:Cu(I)/Ag(I) efflux system membrane fusion protein
MKNLSIGVLLVTVSISLVVLAGCAGPSFTETRLKNMTLAVAVTPDPPKAGENTIKVKLTDAAGKIIRDAKVEITAVMPGMPSMGMLEMRSEVKTEFKNGVFEAPVRLSRDGNWSIFIKVDEENVEYGLTTGSRGFTLKSKSSGGGMGMEEKAGSVAISLEKQQLIGVKTEVARRRQLAKKVRTAGRIAYDPELYTAQTEYLQSQLSSDEAIIAAAKTRLRLLGISDEQREKLSKNGQADENLLLGGKSIWLYASVYEYELPFIKLGQTVMITSPSIPGSEYSGVISSVSPVFDPETRTVKIRAEISNLSGELLPEMFVNVEIDADLGQRLAVSRDAILDSGTRQIIFVDKGNGYFEPRAIKLGLRADPYVEVLAGISEGERVVTSGNFLIDSESRLKN